MIGFWVCSACRLLLTAAVDKRRYRRYSAGKQLKSDQRRTGRVRRQRDDREPGQVKAGICAATEWTWELPPERSASRRGRSGTVIRA